MQVPLLDPDTGVAWAPLAPQLAETHPLYQKATGLECEVRRAPLASQPHSPPQQGFSIVA